MDIRVNIHELATDCCSRRPDADTPSTCRHRYLLCRARISRHA